MDPCRQSPGSTAVFGSAESPRTIGTILKSSLANEDQRSGALRFVLFQIRALRTRWNGQESRSDVNDLLYTFLLLKALPSSSNDSYLVATNAMSRSHIFTNSASIAYSPTRLRSFRNDDRGTRGKYSTERRSDAVADSCSINDALHPDPDTSRQLYNVLLVSWSRCMSS
jgi:hypothetical protein